MAAVEIDTLPIAYTIDKNKMVLKIKNKSVSSQKERSVRIFT